MIKQILMMLTIAGLLIASPMHTYAMTIDFEGLADLESVTNQFPGLTFVNTVVFKAGFTLNDSDFPPHSGDNVVLDEGGPLMIEFDMPQGAVSGFFTYVSQLTFTAFDALNNPVAMMMSAFTENFVSSGNPANELLSVMSLTNNIDHVTITGDFAGGSFVLDDLTFIQVTTSVPEPSTLILLASGLAGLVGWKSVRRFIIGHHI